jgi:FSR family fosmidomycin resistance protein-like MFS transporter
MARTSNERRIIAFTSGAHALTHMHMLILPALVMPLSRDLGQPISEVLAWYLPGYLLFGLGAYPAGWATDHWSARGMLAVNMAGCGLMCLLCALAPSGPWLAAAHAGVGLFASIYHPAGMGLLTRAVRKRGSALGINGMVGNVGQAAAPLAAGLIAVTFGWRWAWVALGAPALLLGLALALTSLDERAPEPIEAGASPEDSERRLPWFLLLCVAMMLAGLAYGATTVVLPTFFEARTSFLDDLMAPLASLAPAGAATAAATALTSGAYLLGIGGQALGGAIADRFDLRRAYLLFHLCALPFAGAMAIVTEVPLFACAAAYVFFALGMQPIENSLVARLSPPALRSRAYGIKFTLTFGVGSLAVPAVAWLGDAHGLPSVFAAVAATSIVIVVVVLALWGASARAVPKMI